MNRAIAKLLSFVAFMVVAQASFAQNLWEDNPKWGADIETRKENVKIYSYLNESIKDRAFDEATGYFQHLIKSAPAASERIYTNGVAIYKAKIAEAVDPKQKQAMVDSLIIVYDLRVSNFGDHPERGRKYIYGQRLRDYIEIRSNAIQNINKYFEQAVEAAGNDIEPNLLATYFKAIADEYRNDGVEVKDLLSSFERSMDLAEHAPVSQEMDQAEQYIESLFLQSGAADCKILEEMYKEKLAAHPEDDELLEKAVAMLQSAKCNSDFFLSIAEKFYLKKPSSNTALWLAQEYDKRNDSQKAFKYLNEAVANETDPVQKANLSTAIAMTMLGQQNGKGALDMARQALAINPSDGNAKFAQAQASWLLISASCSGFERQAGSWLVYDMLSEARRLSSGYPDRLQNIDAQMSSFRGAFPSKEECFFRSIDDGQSYTVSCGAVSGKTTVRTGK